MATHSLKATHLPRMAKASIYVYIYIERERETYMYNTYIYIYMYIIERQTTQFSLKP